MNVLDIRNVFSDRNTELVDFTPFHVYYAERKSETDLYLVEYNRRTNKERLLMNYTFDDPSFAEHIFAFEKTILVILENASNSMWLIELDKKTGGELNRRKLVCTGCFKECMALDPEHILIYMSPDEENNEVFEKYKEATGCGCLCYLYNVRTNSKYFVNYPMIARLTCSEIKQIGSGSESWLVFPDPYSDEASKEYYYREQRWINADIRDNIWLCRTEDVINDIEQGSESVRRKCIASADIKALVRYMGCDDSRIFFRAKEFRTGIEKICSYDIAAGALAVEATLQPPKYSFYLVEEKPFKTFVVKNSKTVVQVQGLVNVQCDLSYDAELGEFVTLIDDKFCLTRVSEPSDGSGTEYAYYCLYNTETGKHQRYACNCLVKGDTLVLC